MHWKTIFSIIRVIIFVNINMYTTQRTPDEDILYLNERYAGREFGITFDEFNTFFFLKMMLLSQ